jgi:hypothetical protein
MVVVCMKLHNFIVSKGSIAVPDAYEEDNAQHVDAPENSVHAQDGLDTDGARHRRRRDLETYELREQWTRKLMTWACDVQLCNKKIADVLVKISSLKLFLYLVTSL